MSAGLISTLFYPQIDSTSEANTVDTHLHSASAATKPSAGTLARKIAPVPITARRPMLTSFKAPLAIHKSSPITTGAVEMPGRSWDALCRSRVWDRVSPLRCVFRVEIDAK